MADPYESPDGETPTERRQRLLNLTNEAWEPETQEEQLQKAVEAKEPARPAPSKSAKE
jgi:hypothetical protein